MKNNQERKIVAGKGEKHLLSPEDVLKKIQTHTKIISVVAFTQAVKQFNQN